MSTRIPPLPPICQIIFGNLHSDFHKLEQFNPFEFRNINILYEDALLDDLRQKGYVKQNMVEGYKYVMNARNYAAHNPEDAADIDWQKAYEIAKELLTGLGETAKVGYIFVPNDDLLHKMSEIVESKGKRIEAINWDALQNAITETSNWHKSIKDKTDVIEKSNVEISDSK
jgi:hypothetical protein